MSATSDPSGHLLGGHDQPPRRLNRTQQLTLTAWRWASARVLRDYPRHVLAQAAISAVLAVLRDTTDPLALFDRHASRKHEFALVASLLAPEHSLDQQLDVLDSAFLLRWQELTAGGSGPEELPPLRRRTPTES